MRKVKKEDIVSRTDRSTTIREMILSFLESCLSVRRGVRLSGDVFAHVSRHWAYDGPKPVIGEVNRELRSLVERDFVRSFNLTTAIGPVRGYVIATKDTSAKQPAKPARDERVVATDESAGCAPPSTEAGLPSVQQTDNS